MSITVSLDTNTEPETSSTPVTASDLVDGGWLDDMMKSVGEHGLQLNGEGGFLPALIKAVLERGLAAELSDHLGYEKGEPRRSRRAEQPQRVDPENGADRGRSDPARHPARPRVEFRAAAGSERLAPIGRRPRRHDRQPVRGRNDSA